MYTGYPYVVWEWDMRRPEEHPLLSHSTLLLYLVCMASVQVKTSLALCTLVFNKQSPCHHVTPKQLSGHHHQPEKPKILRRPPCVHHTPAPSGPVLCPFNITQTPGIPHQFCPFRRTPPVRRSPLGAQTFCPFPTNRLQIHPIVVQIRQAGCAQCNPLSKYTVSEFTSGGDHQD